MLIGERIPNRYQVEHKTYYGAFSRKGINPAELLYFAIGAVDFNRPVCRINQPAQLGALRKVLGHFRLQSLQPVAIGSNLNHEVGAKMPERLALIGTELCDAGLQSPRCVGRAASTIGQNEAGGGIANDTAVIFFGPIAQLSEDMRVGSTHIGMSWRHDNEFPLGGHFKIQFGMLRAKGGELLVGHEMRTQGSRKQSVVDGERHGFSLSRLESCNVWRQSDEITVVTVRRAA